MSLHEKTRELVAIGAAIGSGSRLYRPYSVYRSISSGGNENAPENHAQENMTW